MTTFDWIAAAALALALVGAGLVVAGYPLLLAVVAGRRGGGEADPERPTGDLPTVSVVVAVRNGAALIDAKVADALAQEYPPERLEVVAVSDGSTDDTEARLGALAGPRVRVDAFAEHVGKASALNRAVELARGDVLVFTDADARLEPGAVAALVRALRDPAVGGACGRRVIGEAEAFGAGAQASYVGLDSRIKLLETRVGSITSNDGKLYAVRRALFRPVPDAVTDDLFQGLSVVAQGARFVFEPGARARIRVPSRSVSHELSRRRRIVARSLRGIWLNRELLDPRRHGLFAFGLAVNKVLRRLLPVSLVLLLLASAALAVRFPVLWLFVVAQLGAYAFALLDARRVRAGRAPLGGRLGGLVAYFCVGNLGTLLGVVDFLRRRFVAKWDPVKADSGA